MLRSLIEPMHKLLNVTSKPAQVTHSLENAYGNSLLKLFRVLVFTFLQANGSLLQARH
jgi:hypothetical protein